jgi:hypothetical protein
MESWQKFGKSLEELFSILLNGPDDGAKQQVQAAYIIGLIQSDANRDFPAEPMFYLLECQKWEKINSIPDEQILQERIKIINYYKNLQPPIQPVALQPPIQPVASQHPIQQIASQPQWSTAQVSHQMSSNDLAKNYVQNPSL